MGGVTILDGGMGRELKRVGAPFRQPEWSALALIEAPERVARVHQSYLDAGAEVITTNSYALVPFHLGDERFERDGQALADRAGQVARQAADAANRPSVSVAGSLPPLFGSYRPDLFDPDRAAVLLAPLVAGLAPHVDLWLAETLSATAELKAVAAALGDDRRPRWFSCTLRDEGLSDDGPVVLRSGEPIDLAVEAAIAGGGEALLFNCSQPEVMERAIRSASLCCERLGAALKLGVYANAFPPQPKEAKANEVLMPLRDDLDPPGYLGWVRHWVGAGATIVGGCCGIGPEHIAALAADLRSDDSRSD